jgi:hypothetical protein
MRLVLVKVIAVFCFIAATSACAMTQTGEQQAPEPASNSAAVVKPKKPLDQIDISKIGHIASKGRVQDLDYNKLEVVADLIANGKDCIPYLISKLDDKTKLDVHVMDYWNDVTVGDITLVILSDFSIDSTWRKETIPGMSWTALAHGICSDKMASIQCLSSMLEKYGRKGIKAKWQAVWEKHKSEIYWDDKERAFAVKQ